MGLTGKQERFVTEYLRDFNATQAAIRAGYSQNAAAVIGCENLRKPNIIEALRERIMPAEETMLRITDIARGDMADLMDITTAGFTFRLVEEIDGQRVVNPKTKLIKKIKQKVTTFIAKNESDEDREIIETELELYSAHEALRDIGKFHKLFVDNVDQKHSGEVVFRVVHDLKRNPDSSTGSA